MLIAVYSDLNNQQVVRVDNAWQWQIWPKAEGRLLRVITFT